MIKLFTPYKPFKNALLLLALLCSVLANGQKDKSVEHLRSASSPNIIKADLQLDANGALNGSFYITKAQYASLTNHTTKILVTIPKKDFPKGTSYTYKNTTVNKDNNSFEVTGTDLKDLDKDPKRVDIKLTNTTAVNKNGTITFIYDENGTAPAATNNAPTAKTTATTKKGCNKKGCTTCGSDTACNTCHEMPTVIYTIDACLPGCKAVCSNMDRRHHAMIVRQNEFVAMRIKNLNPFRYTYDINSTEVALNMDDQASFQNALKNSGLPIGSSSSNSALPSDSNNKIAKDTIQKSTDSIEKLLQKNKKLEKAPTTENELNKFKVSNSDLFVDKESITPASIKEMIATNKRLIEELQNFLSNTSKAEIDRGTSKVKTADSLVTACYNKFEDQIKILQTQTCIDAGTTNLFLQNAQTQIDSIIAVYGLPDTLTSLMKILKDNFLPKINDKDSSAYKTKIQSAQTTIDGNYKTKLTTFQKEVNKYRATSLELTTLPYQPKAKNIDLIEYDLSVTDNNTKKTNTYTYNVFVRNGFKIDFSTGIFITGLKDKTFTTQDSVLSDTATVKAGAAKKKILAQNTGPLDFMVGALVNLTWRTSEMFSVGASFGLAFSTQTKFQFIFGPALTFGKFYRVSLHAGMALGKVTDLDAAYQVNKYYNLTSGSVPTTDKFGYSWFAGVTYNFLKVQKDKPKTN